MRAKAEVVCDEEFPVYRIKRMPSWCATSIDTDLIESFEKVEKDWADMQTLLKHIYDSQEGPDND